MALGWYRTSEIPQWGWTCGYCGKDVGGNVGYHRGAYEDDRDDSRRIYICPHCENPTAFIPSGHGGIEQVPGPPYGSGVQSLPGDVEAVYDEVRRCVQYTAYTAAVLAARKLLMHVAVEQGAPADGTFAACVAYLDDHHVIPASARCWVDALRRVGNEANHELVVMGEDDAKNVLDFAEMLLRIVYEFPARVRR